MKIRSIHEMTRYMTAIFVILILLTNIAAAETFATKEEALIHAASHGALGAVKNFLDSGADANALDKSGKTALIRSG
jgi:hypothetical protein